jgi:hypothetical protein
LWEYRRAGSQHHGFDAGSWRSMVALQAQSERLTAMTKTTAKAVSELMLSMGASLDASISTVQSSESDAEFRKYRDSVSKILITMLLEIMNPLYAEHPDLKPPQLE